MLDDPTAKSNPPSEAHPPTGSYRLLTTLTVSASVVLGAYTTSPTSALGLSSVIFAATGLVLFAAAVEGIEEEGENSTRAAVSANGTLPRRMSVSGSAGRQQLASLRDVAGVIMIVCGIASLIMEPSLAARTISWEPVYSLYKRDWTTIHHFRMLRQVVWMIPVHFIVNILTFILVSIILTFQFRIFNLLQPIPIRFGIPCRIR